MKKRIIILLATTILFVLLIGCSSTSENQKIEGVIRDFYTAVSKGDIVGLRDTMTEKAFKEDGAEQIAGMLGIKEVTSYKLLSVTPMVIGNSATAITKLESSSGTIDLTFSLVRVNKDWKIDNAPVSSATPKSTPVPTSTSTTGTLFGTIFWKTPDGSPVLVTGATVNVWGDSNKNVASGISDNTGRYSVYNIPAGQGYLVTGHQDASATSPEKNWMIQNIPVVAGGTTQLDLTYETALFGQLLPESFR